jgi:hypothetical protein
MAMLSWIAREQISLFGAQYAQKTPKGTVLAHVSKGIKSDWYQKTRSIRDIFSNFCRFISRPFAAMKLMDVAMRKNIPIMLKISCPWREYGKNAN